MIISKHPDGTMSYSGIAFDILEYNAKALNIRKLYFKLILSYLIRSSD